MKQTFYYRSYAHISVLKYQFCTIANRSKVNKYFLWQPEEVLSWHINLTKKPKTGFMVI